MTAEWKRKVLVMPQCRSQPSVVIIDSVQT